MSHDENDSSIRDLRLRPYQRALVDSVCSPEEPTFVVLKSDSGLGVSTTIAATAVRCMRLQPDARALIPVTFLARGLYLARLLEEAGLSVVVLDRNNFHRWFEGSAGEVAWPSGTIYMLGAGLALSPSVLEAVSAIVWDLVVFEEAPMKGGRRAAAWAEIGSHARRVLLAMPLNGSFPLENLPHEPLVVEWRRETIARLSAGTPYQAWAATLVQHSYDLAEVEIRLGNTVAELLRAMRDDPALGPLRAKMMARSYEASLTELERALQRVSDPVPFPSASSESSDSSEELMLDEDVFAVEQRLPGVAAVELAQVALQTLESIPSDSKLKAFGELVSMLNTRRDDASTILVLARHKSTLYYLAAEIKGRQLALSVLHGGMSPREKRDALGDLRSRGGIVIASNASAGDEVSSESTRDVILYDLPAPSGIRRLVGNLVSIDRSERLNIHVLVPTGGRDDFAPEALKTLRELLKPTKGESTYE